MNKVLELLNGPYGPAIFVAIAVVGILFLIFALGTRKTPSKQKQHAKAAPSQSPKSPPEKKAPDAQASGQRHQKGGPGQDGGGRRNKHRRKPHSGGKPTEAKTDVKSSEPKADDTSAQVTT